MDIVDKHVRRLRFKDVVLVKVAWRELAGEEMTWEPEIVMCQKYHHLFETLG